MSSIKRNFFYNALLNLSKVLFPLITAPYVARVLSPDGLGTANFAASFTGYFMIFAALGIPTHGMREIAKLRNDREALSRTVSELFSLSYVLVFIVSLAFFSTFLFVDRVQNDAWLFFITGVAMYLAPLDVGWYFSGEERFGFITARHLTCRIIGIISIFLFVHDRDDVLFYVLINTLCGVLGQIWSFALMMKDGVRLRFTLKGIGKHLKPSLVLFASSVAVSVYTMLDTVMLGFMSEYSEVAYYNCATNISKSIVAIVTSLSAVVVPRISFYYQNGEEDRINGLMGKSLSIVSYIAIPAAFGLACIAPVFTPLFYGGMYDDAILPLQILSFLIIAIGLSNLTAWQALIGLGKDKVFLYVVMIGAVLNLLLNVLLIPRFGADGASVSSLIAEAGVLVASVVAVYRCTFIRLSGEWDILKSVTVSLFFYPLLRLLSTFLDGWILVGVFCLTGFVVYFVFQLLMRNSASFMVMDTINEMLRKYVKHESGTNLK